MDTRDEGNRKPTVHSIKLITVPECKTMNCIAQAICRNSDDWWK